MHVQVQVVHARVRVRVRVRVIALRAHLCKETYSYDEVNRPIAPLRCTSTPFDGGLGLGLSIVLILASVFPIDRLRDARCQN